MMLRLRLPRLVWAELYAQQEVISVKVIERSKKTLVRNCAEPDEIDPFGLSFAPIAPISPQAIAAALLAVTR